MAPPPLKEKPPVLLKIQTTEPGAVPFQEQVKSLQRAFDQSLRECRVDSLISALLTLDKLIWKSSREFEEDEKISEARETLRGMIVQLGLRFDELPKDIPSLLTPLMNLLLEVRGKLRSAKQWELSDFIRDRLAQAGVVVEDSPEGPKWRMETDAKRIAHSEKEE
jgi:cysteinyl-tRNA synthetase